MNELKIKRSYLFRKLSFLSRNTFLLNGGQLMEYREYRKNFFNKFNELKKSIYERRVREEAELWLKLQDAILSGNFSTVKRANEFARLWLEGYNDYVVSLKLNMQESTIRQYRKQLSDELYDITGDDFFSLFENFSKNEEKLNKILYILFHTRKNGWKGSSDLIPLDLYAIFKAYVINEEDIDFSIDDCRKELSFISRFSVQNIKEEMNKLNLEKLKYIIGVLEGEKGTTDDKYLVSKCMEGDLND